MQFLEALFIVPFFEVVVVGGGGSFIVLLCVLHCT
jgi:hypothetical protein